MLGYYIVKLFSKFMCISPMWLRKLVAKFLGSVAVAVVPRWRMQMAEANIRECLGVDEARAAEIAADSLHRFGRMVVEVMRFPLLNKDNIDKKVKVLSGGERSRLAMIKLLLEPVNLLILDEPTNHLDMASKEVLKEAINAFDGTAIIVSHDREFLDGLVSKVYEFGGGAVREHLGGIYDYLHSRDISSLNELAAMSQQSAAPAQTVATQQNDDTAASSGKISYAEHKEQQKKIRRVEKLIKESETKIEAMEKRIAEIDTLLCLPENAADMTLINEYTEIKSRMDEEEERWTELSEELEALK